MQLIAAKMYIPASGFAYVDTAACLHSIAITSKLIIEPGDPFGAPAGCLRLDFDVTDRSVEWDEFTEDVTTRLHIPHLIVETLEYDPSEDTPDTVGRPTLLDHNLQHHTLLARGVENVDQCAFNVTAEGGLLQPASIDAVTKASVDDFPTSPTWLRVPIGGEMGRDLVTLALVLSEMRYAVEQDGRLL